MKRRKWPTDKQRIARMKPDEIAKVVDAYPPFAPEPITEPTAGTIIVVTECIDAR